MKKTNYKPPKDKGDIMLNIIIAAVIVAAVAAGTVAVYPKISESVRNSSGTSAASLETAGDAAKDKGMKFKKFIETYGLGDDITKDTSISDTIGAMTLEKVALYNDADLSEFRANNYVPESVSDDTKWSDVIPQLPFKAVVGSEDTANQIISIYGLEDKLTLDTPWSEAEAIMNAAQEEMNQAMENAANAEDTADDNESDDEQSSGAEDAQTDEAPETDASGE